MSKRNRQSEVKTPREQRRMAQYYHATPNNVNELARAYDRGDMQAMRENLTRNVDKGFLGGLYNVYDAEFRETIVKTILNKHSSMVDKEKRARYEPKYKESPRMKKFGKKDRKPRKTVKQKQKSGTTYKRSKPERFSQKEVQFLKMNKSLPNKELVKRFNKLFPDRTKSSIVSKKYRVRK